MKLLELPKDNQEGLLTALLRFTYPLYCTTDVEGYEYFFIGSCFPIRVGERVFFIFTNHQYELAYGKTILIAYPEDANKLIGVESANVARFKNFDLAAFEFTDAEIIKNLHMLDISLITMPDASKTFEYAVLGCQRAVNTVNYETKEIVVKKGALITERASLDSDSAVFDFSGMHMIVGSEDTLHNITTINERTQGLSGAPVVAYAINEMGDTKGDMDLHLVGIATHVAETDKKLYAAHPMELISALQYAFNIFPWHKNN